MKTAELFYALALERSAWQDLDPLGLALAVVACSLLGVALLTLRLNIAFAFRQVSLEFGPRPAQATAAGTADDGQADARVGGTAPPVTKTGGTWR